MMRAWWERQGTRVQASMLLGVAVILYGLYLFLGLVTALPASEGRMSPLQRNAPELLELLSLFVFPIFPVVVMPSYFRKRLAVSIVFAVFLGAGYWLVGSGTGHAVTVDGVFRGLAYVLSDMSPNRYLHLLMLAIFFFQLMLNLCLLILPKAFDFYVFSIFALAPLLLTAICVGFSFAR